ncbi:MAG: HEAT repeat domain-containing protein [Clostridium sp.]
MKGSTFIIVTIILFSYIVIAIMIYVGIARLKENLDSRKLKEIEEGFGKLILKHLDNVSEGEDIPTNEVQVVGQCIDGAMYLKVFSEVCIEYSKNNGTEVVKRYILNFEKKLYKLFFKVDRKSIMKFSYYIYLIGEFRMENNMIIKKLLDNLNSESIYIRVNSLKALSKIGNINGFIDALRIISLRGLYFNEKVIIDSIDSFEGNKDELDSIILSEINNYTDDMTNIVINHFSNNKYKKCSNTLLKMINNKKTSKEVIIRIVRYFEEVYNSDAQDSLINLLDSSYWETRAVTSRAMIKYDVNKAEEKLKNLVSDRNYHVRYNAAMTLISRGKGDRVVNEIINGEDKYARDIMVYAMFNNNLINYDEYMHITAFKEVDKSFAEPSYEAVNNNQRQEALT